MWRATINQQLSLRASVSAEKSCSNTDDICDIAL